MTDTALLTNRLALLMAESPDQIVMNDLLSSIEHTLEVAEQLGFGDTVVLVRAARLRAIADIIGRFY